MGRRRLVVMLLCVLVAGTCLLGGCAQSADKLRFGTGGSGGTYYAIGEALAPELEKNTGRNVEVTETTGSDANLRLLETDVLDIAIAQGDVLANEESAGEGDSGDAINYSAIAGLYVEPCQIVVTASSRITSVSDLRGKRVSIGEEESGVTVNAQQILMANGLSPEMMDAERLSFSAAADAMRNGDLDAFFCTAGVPTKAIADLAEDMPIRLLSLDERAVEQLMSLYPQYVSCVIPAGTYRGVYENVQTLGVQAVLVAQNALPNDTVEEITRTVFDSMGTLQGITNNMDLTPGASVSHVAIPFHPGAAQYYAGLGIEVTAWEPPAQELTFPIQVSLDMYQTMAVAVAMLFLGAWLKKKWKFLETFCIPAPVVGGLLFAIASCILYATGFMELSFNETMRDVCMVMFFTTVGFQANLRVLKTGGPALAIFLGCVIALIFAQNFTAVGVAQLIGVDPLVGLSTGSIPMVGGHGTSGAFGPVLEGLGLEGATSLCTAAATFGLVAGSLMGGPLGRRLILKHNLQSTVVPVDPADTDEVLPVSGGAKDVFHKYASAAYQLAIAMGIGTLVSWLLSKTGMTFPVYIGSMIVAAVMRNLAEYSGKFKVPMPEVNSIGDITLSIFLGIAMITLKLWQLAALALPLIILLLVQTVLMYFFANHVVFNLLGRDYDAAVLAAGTCGFGMGATPNAMANMQAVTEKYGPSVKAYLIVPIVGSMFADFINTLTIAFFLSIL